MPNKKYGPQIDLRRRNSSGVGKLVPAGRTKQHVNLKTCKTCGAKAGQTCFRLTGRSFVEFNHTHSGIEVRRDEYVERPENLSANELADRRSKRSTPQLDRALHLRDQRKVDGRKRVNGG
jgi:hypothetical protein